MAWRQDSILTYIEFDIQLQPSYLSFSRHWKPVLLSSGYAYYVVRVSIPCLHMEIFQSRSRTQSSSNYTLSKLNFVDLAGSERLGKTKVSYHLCTSIPFCRFILILTIHDTTHYSMYILDSIHLFPGALALVRCEDKVDFPFIFEYLFQSEGLTKKEAMYINQSLTFLEQVGPYSYWANYQIFTIIYCD